MVFRTAAIVALHIINLFVFITEMERVYSAVRTELLNVIQATVNPIRNR